jgi:hypothetical protein
MYLCWLNWLSWKHEVTWIIFLSICPLLTIHNKSRQEEFILFDQNQFIQLKNSLSDAILIYLCLSEDAILFS